MTDEESTADDKMVPSCGEPREGVRMYTPVDRSKRCMLSGEKETPEHREIDLTGCRRITLCSAPRNAPRGSWFPCGGLTST